MKIPKKRSSILLTATIILLLVAACVFAYTTWGKSSTQSADKSDSTASDQKSSSTTDSNPDTGVSNEPSSNDVSSSSDSVKNQTNSSNGSDGSAGSGTSGVQTGPTITITTAQNTGSQVQIRTLIDKVTQSGACSLKMTSSGKTVSKTSGIQALPNGATCQGFNIPLSELSKGTWKITVTYTDGSNSSLSNSQQVSV